MLASSSQKHPEGTPGEVLLTKGLQSLGARGWDLQQRGRGETDGFLCTAVGSLSWLYPGFMQRSCFGLGVRG